MQSNEPMYWKVSLVTFGTISLATGIIRVPGFWSSYMLDIMGPAWNYILIRGLFSRTQPAMLSRILIPEAALVLIVAICFLVEVAQYLRLYESTYDPFDFVAYVSLIVPCYIIDRRLLKRHSAVTPSQKK